MIPKKYLEKVKPSFNRQPPDIENTVDYVWIVFNLFD